MTSALAGVPAQRRAPERSVDLSSAVLSLAEAEVDAAADVLHDGALQALVVARYAADAAVRGGDPTAARDAVQEALVALRRAVWLLRPRGAQGLLEALEQLSAKVVDAGGAPVVVDADPAAAAVVDTDLAPVAATVAYRLVQRAAGPAPLTVLVRRTATGLRIALDVPLADPAAEGLRARAVGGALLATRDGASLHLPLLRTLTTAVPAPAGSAAPDLAGSAVPAPAGAAAPDPAGSADPDRAGSADDARPEVLR